MARIEFPEPQADGEKFKYNGVLYQYQGTPPSGFWAANSQNILIDTFVDTAGDVMEGDLTISNLSGSGTASVAVDETGKLVRADQASTITSPFVNKSGGTLTGGLDFVNSLGNVTLSLGRLGFGTFSGDLVSGVFDANTANTYSSHGGGVVSGSLYAKRSDSNSLPVFTGYNIAGTSTSVIYGDGGAEFSGGNISLTATGTVGSSHFLADGPYQSSSGIRQTIKDSALTVGKVVLGDGTTAIGGALAGYPNSGSPNILLSPDGSVTAKNITCTGAVFQGDADDDVIIGASNFGVSTLEIKAGGDASFKDVTLNSVTGQTASFSTSVIAGNATMSDAGISVNNAIQLDSSGDAQFTGDVVINGSATVASLSVSGAVTASSFGAVSGTTADFSGQLTANSAAIQGNVTVSDLSASDIAATGLSLTGDISADGQAEFANQLISLNTDGSIVTHSASSGLELGTIGSGPDSVVLKGLGGSTGAGTGTQRFSFTGDGAASLASDNCIIESNGDVKNTNNSYGGPSDRKLKEDISPAQSQWEDIKAVELVNYSFKAELGWGTGRKLGVISQDLRKICPALVEVKKDYKVVKVAQFDDKGMPMLDEEGNQLYEHVRQETGTKTESVKYSVLYLKAIGALQEAMKRIELLEASINGTTSN